MSHRFSRLAPTATVIVTNVPCVCVCVCVRFNTQPFDRALSTRCFFLRWAGRAHAMPGSVKRAAGGPSPPELWFWIPECPTRNCTEAAFKRARVQSYVNEVFTEPCQACNLSCENCISECELDSNFAGSCFCTSRPGAAPPFVHTQSDSRQCSDTPSVVSRWCDLTRERHSPPRAIIVRRLGFLQFRLHC